jgi:hypothetical protein
MPLDGGLAGRLFFFLLARLMTETLPGETLRSGAVFFNTVSPAV